MVDGDAVAVSAAVAPSDEASELDRAAVLVKKSAERSGAVEHGGGGSKEGSGRLIGTLARIRGLFCKIRSSSTFPLSGIQKMCGWN